MGTDTKLWILVACDGLPDDDNPWNPWYDKVFGFVIEAASAEQARELAHAAAGDENRGEFLGKEVASTKTPWLDSKYSTCFVLKPIGETEIVMKDFRAT